DAPASSALGQCSGMHLERRGCRICSVGDPDLIADGDRAAVEDVRPEPASMDERTKQTRTGEPLKVCAWFSQASTDAFDRIDLEPVPDEAVQCNATRHDVPTCLIPRQVDRVQHFRLDERQLVAVSRSAESSPTLVVAISLQSAPGNRLDHLDASERPLGVKRGENGSDRTDP